MKKVVYDKYRRAFQNCFDELMDPMLMPRHIHEQYKLKIKDKIYPYPIDLEEPVFYYLKTTLELKYKPRNQERVLKQYKGVESVLPHSKKRDLKAA